MSGIFRYSIVRFRPFAETGEFANIGVVVIDPNGAIAFELAPKRFSRIKHFFDAATHEAYAAAIDFLRLELARVSEFLPTIRHSGDAIFHEITRERESSIIFSKPRVMEASVPLQAVVERLFGRYIKRDFATPEAPETVLAKDIRLQLHKNGLTHFKTIRIEDEVVPIQFPLAYRGEFLRAIKPLAFAQKNPLGVFDYGAHWRQRLTYLLDRKKIRDADLLIAIEGPRNDADEHMQHAFEVARGELNQLPFEIIEAEQYGLINPRIIDFAREVSPERHLVN